MKYFKYKKDNKIQKLLLKERINALDKNQKRNYKINSFVGKTAVVVFIVLFVMLYSLSIIVIKTYISSTILSIIIGIFLFLLSIILPAFIVFPILSYVFKKYPTDGLPRVIREMRTRSNEDYFKYYKIIDNYIITKIYDCSVSNLVNKDCIVFFYDNKLRITNDFTTSSNDFGCYEFELEDISLYYDKTSKLLKTVIESKDIKIILGKRAKPFIVRKGN
jgi:hypothetical protein